LFHKSDPTRRQNFIAVLERCNMVVNIRQSKGQDIAAACGQLVREQAKMG
jgi:23S rRNA (adenine2503-C2)-methyltransferase